MTNFSKEEVRAAISDGSDYWIGRHVFGYLGYQFARVLLKTRITPNQLTWFWGCLMFVSSFLLIFGNWYLNVIAGIGWIIGYSLDYTDGCIARLKNIRSKRGMFLDYINHSINYPMLMVCAGIGVYRSGGCPWIDLFPDYWYLVLGVVAGLCIVLIMLMPTLYRRACPEDDIESSRSIEGGLAKNSKTFELFMNLNPLVFTNMMFCILVFSLIGQMWLFVLGYGVGYALGFMFRFAVMYRKIPARFIQ